MIALERSLPRRLFPGFLGACIGLVLAACTGGTALNNAEMGGPGPGPGSTTPAALSQVPNDHIPEVQACVDGAPAPRTLRRLTLRELNNTLVDLLGNDPKTPQGQTLFGNDPVAYGFHNIQIALQVRDDTALQLQTLAESVGTYASTHLAAVSSCTTLDASCRQKFISSFGQRAFRAPLTPAQVQDYDALMSPATDFPTGVATVVSAMLQSPYFLYRRELGASAGNTFALSSYEIASELSYLTIASMPDAPLMQAAAANQLTTPEQLTAQVQRLLQDPRSRGTLDGFFINWLGVGELGNLSRSENNASLDPPIKAAMQTETRMLAEDVFFTKKGSFADLMQANYTFLNGPLATFYGMAGASGDAFTQVPLAAGGRAPGVIGQGAVLSANAQATFASPTLRGRMVRMRMLCQSVPPPPPGVPQLEPAGSHQTTRQRFEAHVTNPTCSSCHTMMDPIGFSLGDFDTLGRQRAGGEEDGIAVDTHGSVNAMPDNSADAPLTDAKDLSAFLAGSAQAQACMTRHLTMFTLGQVGFAQDGCTFDAVAQDAASHSGNLMQALMAVVRAKSFSQRSMDP